MTRRTSFALGIALVLLATDAVGQASPRPVPSQAGADAAPIQDNSFLVEEAYNQDAGTVQHASTFARGFRGRDWAYGFTQEWAVRGQRHQLSATIPFAQVEGDAGAARGLGDISLNYRYQVSGIDGGPVAVAPRLTLIVPTGRASDGLGAGATSIQAMLPASIKVGDKLVMHLNAGFTRVGHASSIAERAPATMNYTLAHSFVWLTAQRVNLLFETVWNSIETIDDGGRSREQQLVVSPGIRWSYDLPRHLQVVPGLAVPLGVGPSRGDRSLFAYLSFEHPY
jgi:hypothetical protein